MWSLKRHTACLLPIFLFSNKYTFFYFLIMYMFFDSDNIISYTGLLVYLCMGKLRKCIGDFQSLSGGFKRGIQTSKTQKNQG